MKWVRFSTDMGSTPQIGILVGSEIVQVTGHGDLVSVHSRGQDSAAAIATEAISGSEPRHRLEDVQIVAPVDPPSVRDAMCFHEHIRRGFGTDEIDPLHHRFPTFYFSNPASILGPTDLVKITPKTERFDYEVEVAVVIGLPGENIAPSEATKHIAGYVVFCDWSARDVQVEEMSLKLGPAKGKDGATSLGPYLVTLDSLEKYRHGLGYDLAMTARVNGEQTSVGNWSSIDWAVEDVIAYTSRGTTLRAGDVIGLGTVGGGSLGEQRIHDPENFPGFLDVGDEVVISVEELGEIRTKITDHAPFPPLSTGH